MSNKILIGIFMLLLFFIPAVGAVTVTQDDYETGDVLESLTTLDVILSDVNDSYDYTIFGYVGNTLYPDYIGDNMGIAGEFFYRDVTDAGTYTFTLDDDNFPFEGLPHDIHVHTRAYYPSNHTYVSGEESNQTTTVTFGTPATYHQYRLMFRNHEPSRMTESDTPYRDGTSVEVAFIRYDNETGDYLPANTVPYMDVYVADYNLEMFAFGVDVMGFADDGTGYEFDTFNYTAFDDYDLVYHGLKPHVITTLSSHYAFNNTYTVFYGIRTTTGSSVTADNLHITCDDSMSVTLFSLDDYDSICDIELDHSDAYDYFGVACTFHVYPTERHRIPEGFTPGTIGQIAQDYGNSIGMPFFPLFIVFLVIGVMTSIPFAFAVRFDLSVPNFVYATFISLGVIISYGLGLLDVWMTVFYFIVLLLALFIKYSDQLRTIGQVPGVILEKPIVRPPHLRAGSPEDIAYAKRMKKKRKDEGVRRRNIFTKIDPRNIQKRWSHGGGGKSNPFYVDKVTGRKAERIKGGWWNVRKKGG